MENTHSIQSEFMINECSDFLTKILSVNGKVELLGKLVFPASAKKGVR